MSIVRLCLLEGHEIVVGFIFLVFYSPPSNCLRYAPSRHLSSMMHKVYCTTARPRGTVLEHKERPHMKMGHFAFARTGQTY